MPTIRKLLARELLDSRGNPALEVEVHTEKTVARAMVPSGASTGVHEALELRDKDPHRFNGKGLLKACRNVNNTIAQVLVGQTFEHLAEIDKKLIELDGSPNKSNLGANTILGVSLACAHAAAQEQGVALYRFLNPAATLLPVPMMNILNGGAHAVDSGIDIQEFMIVPVGAQNFKHAIQIGAEIFRTLKALLHEKNYATTVGDEGGYAPSLKQQEEALDFIVKAIEESGYRPGVEVAIALDPASSEFYDSTQQKYRLRIKGVPHELTSNELIDFWEGLIEQYPIVSLEDGLAEDDWAGWQKLTQQLGHKVQLVGDDFLVTNVNRLKQAIEQQAGNAILIKMNQIGTLTETIEAITMAKAVQPRAWGVIASHRSGETEDTTLADLAVGMETGQIKTGSLCRGERTAKYNQLMRIEEELGEKARYGGGGLTIFFCPIPIPHPPMGKDTTHHS